MKQIKELKDQEKLIKNKLSILLSKEKFLNEQDFYNCAKKNKLIPRVAQFSFSPEERLEKIEIEKIKQQKKI